MEFPILNKFEKKEKVIELHKEGKTLKDIAPIVHMSFRDISKIIKTYDKKIRLQSNQKENNPANQIKKPSISHQAFKLFREGKELTDVAIDLEIRAKKAVKLWFQFQRLERMFDFYEFYKTFQYQIPELLAISTFIRQNQVDITNIANVLKNAKDLLHLQSYRSAIQQQFAKNKLENHKQKLENI